jgi:hypothetical protein
LLIYGVFYILAWCMIPKGRQTLGEFVTLAQDLAPKDGTAKETRG